MFEAIKQADTSVVSYLSVNRKFINTLINTSIYRVESYRETHYGLCSGMQLNQDHARLCNLIPIYIGIYVYILVWISETCTRTSVCVSATGRRCNVYIHHLQRWQRWYNRFCTDSLILPGHDCHGRLAHSIHPLEFLFHSFYHFYQLTSDLFRCVEQIPLILLQNRYRDWLLLCYKMKFNKFLNPLNPRDVKRSTACLVIKNLAQRYEDVMAAWFFRVFRKNWKPRQCCDTRNVEWGIYLTVYNVKYSR